VEADAPITNGVTSSNADSEKKSISSLEPRPPTPSTPSTAHHPNEIGLPPSSAEDNTNQVRSMFQSKRLCERWLDNLFMVLYEDLRVYTLWRAEWEHFTKQQLQFNKQNNEWEMLGELALRLHHKVRFSVYWGLF
jgi:flagellar hook-length control protein FliK